MRQMDLYDYTCLCIHELEELVIVMSEHMNDMKKRGENSEYNKIMNEIRRAG